MPCVDLCGLGSRSPRLVLWPPLPSASPVSNRAELSPQCGATPRRPPHPLGESWLHRTPFSSWKGQQVVLTGRGVFSRWDFTPRSSASITNTGPRVTPPPTQGPTLWHRRSGRDTCQGPLVPSDATAAGSCQAREVTARPQLKCRLRDDRLQSDAPSSRKPSVLTAMMWRGWGAGGGLSLADRTQAEA